MAHSHKSWHRDAACSSVGSELFYADEDPGLRSNQMENYQTLRRICDTCPVRRECRLAGVTEQWGMWGGLTPRERTEMRREFMYRLGVSQRNDYLDQVRAQINRVWGSGGVDGVIEKIPALDHPKLHEDRAPIDVIDVDLMVIDPKVWSK